MKRSPQQSDNLRKKRKVSLAPDHHHNTHESTATADEGQIMAQVYNSFSPVEQARFEAFRRSTFPGEAVSKFISSCLVDISNQRHNQRHKTRQLLGAKDFGVHPSHTAMIAALEKGPPSYNYIKGNNSNKNNNSPSSNMDEINAPDLSDVVATNSAQEITLVVSTIAKVYAQRLIQSARNVATAEGYDPQLKLLPHHVLEAHRHRVKAGVDPGFFMQPGFPSSSSSTVDYSSSSAAALGIVDKHRIKLEAALQAQESYNKLKREQEQDEDEQIH